ncbi:MAG TPA: BON domain-containing protein [Usitatibacter sp.]|nr:BON domain-containing protein [Usitatibacter sp.]
MKMTALHAALLAALTSFALVSCDRESATDRTVGQKLDSAITRTQQKLAEAGENTQEALAQAAEKTQQKLSEAGDKLAQRTDKAVGAVADQVALSANQGVAESGKVLSDTAITASIKTDYLKDPDLSVLKIDVDTRSGVVTLNGLAETDEARARAERIASAIKGVKEVRNYLVVKRVG